MQNEKRPAPADGEVSTSPPRVFIRRRRAECQRPFKALSVGVDSSPAGERSRSLVLGRAVEQVLRYAKRLVVTR
jgi:hypothetical protein